MVAQGDGADAAGLAFDALERAKREGADVLLIDTAGRLHNKAALMDELRKIIRVHQEDGPGGAAVRAAGAGRHHRAERAQQVEVFEEMVDVTGLVVTKLDGSARGGVRGGAGARSSACRSTPSASAKAWKICARSKPESFARSLDGP